MRYVYGRQVLIVQDVNTDVDAIRKAIAKEIAGQLLTSTTKDSLDIGGEDDVLPLQDPIDEYCVQQMKDLDWTNRDRFVLSSGHGCMLQYSVPHFIDPFSMSMYDIKQYRQGRPKAPGHLEDFVTAGIEGTIGPMGMGVTNDMGLAAVEAHHSAAHHSLACRSLTTICIASWALVACRSSGTLRRQATRSTSSWPASRLPPERRAWASRMPWASPQSRPTSRRSIASLACRSSTTSTASWASVACRRASPTSPARSQASLAWASSLPSRRQRHHQRRPQGLLLCVGSSGGLQFFPLYLMVGL